MKRDRLNLTHLAFHEARVIQMHCKTLFKISFLGLGPTLKGRTKVLPVEKQISDCRIMLSNCEIYTNVSIRLIFTHTVYR